MKKIITLTLLTLFLIIPKIYSSIIGFEELKIDFTDKNDAIAKATWSEPDKIDVTQKGLGWDGVHNVSRDSWIQSMPLAVGISWRPAQSINVTVEITPEIKSFTLPNGQISTPYIGNMFVRYSPDEKHWSSWQALDYLKPQGQAVKKRKFATFVNIPQRERTEYIDYMKKYWKLDVPWSSDEEALVEWILSQDPEFFDKRIPFVGYLQFLYETSLPGGQRITEFHATAGFGISGLHHPPKDENAYKDRDSIPWSFKAK